MMNYRERRREGEFWQRKRMSEGESELKEGGGGRWGGREELERAPERMATMLVTLPHTLLSGKLVPLKE